MQLMKSQLKNTASNFGRARRFARNAAIGGFVAVATAPAAFAVPISIDGIEAQINEGATSAGTVAGYVALGLAVLACAGVIFGMLRKS